MRLCLALTVLVLILAFVRATEDAPLSVEVAASKVQQARNNLEVARTNLKRLHEQTHAFRVAKIKAKSDAKAALDEYKNKVTLKGAADNIVLTAKGVSDARLADLNNAKSKAKALQDQLDARTKLKSDKEAQLAQTQRSISAVDTFPNPVVSPSKSELQDLKKQLEQWLADYAKLKSDLDGANSLVKSAQSAYDSAQGDLAAKKQAASDAGIASQAAKDKSNSLATVLSTARVAYTSGLQNERTAHDAVLKGIQNVRLALQARVAAVQSHLAHVDATIERVSRHLKTARLDKRRNEKNLAHAQGRYNAVAAELKETQKQLLEAEHEVIDAKRHLATTRSRVKHALAKLHRAQRESMEFKDPVTDSIVPTSASTHAPPPPKGPSRVSPWSQDYWPPRAR